MAQQTLINGKRYSHASVFITVDGIEVAKGAVTAINIRPQATRGVVFGNASVMTGRTRGQGQTSVDFTILLAEGNDLMDAVSVNGLYAITDREFDIFVQWSENNQQDVETMEAIGFGIDEFSMQSTAGTEATAIQFTGVAARCRVNGIEAYADPAV